MEEGLQGIGLVYRLLATTKADKRIDGYFCGLQKIVKQNGRQKKKKISGDAGACFTTYHRHRRRPVAHRHQRTNAHTGNGPSRKNGCFRSHAYHVRGPGSDRVDHHHSRTWTLHHMQCPRSVVVVVVAAALAPVKTSSWVSHQSPCREHNLHLLLDIADIEGTRLVVVLVLFHVLEIWMTWMIQRKPPSGDAFAAPFPDTST